MNFKSKKFLSFLVFLLLIGGVALTVYQARKTQEIRQRAQQVVYCGTGKITVYCKWMPQTAGTIPTILPQGTSLRYDYEIIDLTTGIQVFKGNRAWQSQTIEQPVELEKGTLIQNHQYVCKVTPMYVDSKGTPLVTGAPGTSIESQIVCSSAPAATATPVPGGGTPTATPRPGAPATPTSPPIGNCNIPCSQNSRCSGILTCIEGFCRDKDCPDQPNCNCPPSGGND